MAARRASKKPLAPFLQAVCDILEKADPSVAAWSRDGTSFEVRDVKAFSKEHLSTHFKSAQFSSFVRQLNFYGFHKVAHDAKKVWTFRHECFLRGRNDLMHSIKRKTSAEYHIAAKGEVADLRQRVGALEGDLTRATEHVHALAELLRVAVGADALASMVVPEHVAAALAAAGLRAVPSRDGTWGAGAAGAGAVDAGASTPAGGDMALDVDDGRDSEAEAEAEARGARRSARRAAGGRRSRDAVRQPVKRRRTDRAEDGGYSPKMSDDELMEEAAALAGVTLNDEELTMLAGDMVVTADDVAPVADAAGAPGAAGAGVADASGSVAADAVFARAVQPGAASTPRRALAVVTSGGKVDGADAIASPLPRLGELESITNAFNASLDFTGAGMSSGPALNEEDGGAWAWAEARQSRDLRISTRPAHLRGHSRSGSNHSLGGLSLAITPSGFSSTPLAWTPSGSAAPAGGAPDFPDVLLAVQ